MPENAIVQSLSCVRLCDHMDHSRLPCPSLSSRACSYSSPLRRWCPNIVASYVLSSFVMGGPFWYQLTHHGHKQKFPVYQIYNEKKLWFSQVPDNMAEGEERGLWIQKEQTWSPTLTLLHCGVLHQYSPLWTWIFSVKCGGEIIASSLSDSGKDYGSDNESACLMHSRRYKHSSCFIMLRDGFVSKKIICVVLRRLDELCIIFNKCNENRPFFWHVLDTGDIMVTEDRLGLCPQGVYLRGKEDSQWTVG